MSAPAASPTLVPKPMTSTRSVPCSASFTGRPRPIPGDDSMRSTTRSIAGTCCGGRGCRCGAMAAHQASTRPPSPTSSATGSPVCSTSWKRNCGRARFRPLPARRVYIPKPGQVELRPLSIPAVRDRVVQAALKIVLEPVFEADMLPCSFGFRPKRSAHDALQVLIDESFEGKRWVVETDIANCFTAIPHDGLMSALSERICDRKVLALLRAFLPAGVMEDGAVRRPVSGTPQGGVVSPLLCNVYLNRLDRAWRPAYGSLVRYADDLLVVCSNRGQAETPWPS